MENSTKQNSITDLRSNKFNASSEIVFEKTFFGGYNKKAVAQYIKDLNDRLANAERSFNQRLEEYSEMSSMLTQERDKYFKLVEQNEGETLKYHNQIKNLEKEIEDLNYKINELNENIPDQDELKLIEEKLLENGELKAKISDLEAQLIESEKYADNNKELKNNIEQLKMTIIDLNEQIENYAKNEITKEEYDVLVSENQSLASENDLIKQQYDDAMYEKSMLTAERNILIEKNKRIADSLYIVNQKNKELRETNTKIKLKTRKIMAEFESKIYECSQNHKHNIEQITDSVKNVLNIITYENMDITKLLSLADLEIDLEKDVADEVNSEEYTSAEVSSD